MWLEALSDELEADGFSIVATAQTGRETLTRARATKPEVMVVDLQIPSFCLTEITDDRRFSNDYLSHTPYSGWAASFAAELAVSGPRFRQDFGHNARLPGE